MKAFRKDGNLLVIVERGEKLVETLTRELKKQGIRGGVISGLGALTDVELGFYHVSTKHYDRKTFTDEYELISVTGNVAVKDGEPFVHVHAVLGDDKFAAFGGHLFEATVAVTAEMSVIPFDFHPERLPNAEIGLALICKLA